jgi:hypothetical protein
MDDYFDDDSLDDDNSFDDNPDGDFEHEDSSEEDQADLTGENTIDIGWQEIALFGALSEQIADEERERLRIEKDMKKDEDEEKL